MYECRVAKVLFCTRFPGVVKAVGKLRRRNEIRLTRKIVVPTHSRDAYLSLRRLPL
jgi:hypothetical protein